MVCRSLSLPVSTPMIGLAGKAKGNSMYVESTTRNLSQFALALIFVMSTMISSNPSLADTTKLSEAIALIAVESTFAPRDFGEKLEAGRSKLTDSGKAQVNSCLAKISEIGRISAREYRPICINGKCDYENPLAELWVWSESMSLALGGERWTHTLAGKTAMLKMQATRAGCQLLPGLCGDIIQQARSAMFSFVKTTAQICD